MPTCEIVCEESEPTRLDNSFTNFIHANSPQPSAPLCLFEENRRRLIKAIREIETSSIILLQGGSIVHCYDTNFSYDFQQESNFYWLFGVCEPDLYGSLDVATGEVVLFAPHVNNGDGIQSRTQSMMSVESIKSQFHINNIASHEDIDDVLRQSKSELVLLLGGTNGETGLELPTARFENRYNLRTNTGLLYPIMADLRAVKTNYEVDAIRRASLITSEAIKYIMLRVKSGSYEFQADAIFKHFCYFSAGCDISSMRGICVSGPNLSNLNYKAPMHRILENGDLLALDMGVKFCGYSSKAAITYPVDGTFKPKQRDIYLVVYSIWKKVLPFIKAGISCEELQTYSQQVLLKNLRTLGLVQGELRKLKCAGIGSIFAPISLVHLAGVDYFDVGGYIDYKTPPRPTRDWLSFLKTTRTLSENMVISFRPCCYILKDRIERALEDEDMSRYLVKEKIDEYLEVGGIRFDDILLVHRDICETLTSVPRAISNLEKWVGQPVEQYLSRVLNETIFKPIYFKIEDRESACLE